MSLKPFKNLKKNLKAIKEATAKVDENGEKIIKEVNKWASAENIMAKINSWEPQKRKKKAEPLKQDENLILVDGEPILSDEDYEDWLQSIDKGMTEKQWLKKRKKENRPIKYQTKPLSDKDEAKVDQHFANAQYVKEHYSAALKAGINSLKMDQIVTLCENDIKYNLDAFDRWHVSTSGKDAPKPGYDMFYRLRVIYDKRGDKENSERIKKLAESLGYKA